MIFIGSNLNVHPHLTIQPVTKVQLHLLALLCSFSPQMLKLTSRYQHILESLMTIADERELQPIEWVIVIVVHVLHPDGLLLGHRLRGARGHQLSSLLRRPDALHLQRERVYLSARFDGLDAEDAQRQTVALFLLRLLDLLAHATFLS